MAFSRRTSRHAAVFGLIWGVCFGCSDEESGQPAENLIEDTTFRPRPDASSASDSAGTFDSSATTDTTETPDGTSGADTSGTSGADTSSALVTSGTSGADTADTTPFTDADGDGVDDAFDNCVGLFNSNQSDLDFDSFGDVCDDDADGDGVENSADPWPNDGAWPVVALANTVYAHSDGALYAMDVNTYQVTPVGNFGWPSQMSSTQMTDIAIDRFGVIYGITFDDLVICRADNAQCRRLGALPSSFNGLTWMPSGTVLPDREALIGIASGGEWYRLDPPVSGASFQATQIGGYSATYTSSGDVFSMRDVGTFAAVNKGAFDEDFLIEVSPTGGLLRELGPIGTYGDIWGVAGWSGKFFGFDASGDVLLIDLTASGTPSVSVIHQGSVSWWGAGVRTVKF